MGGHGKNGRLADTHLVCGVFNNCVCSLWKQQTSQSSLRITEISLLALLNRKAMSRMQKAGLASFPFFIFPYSSSLLPPRNYKENLKSLWLSFPLRLHNKCVLPTNIVKGMGAQRLRFKYLRWFKKDKSSPNAGQLLRHHHQKYAS